MGRYTTSEIMNMMKMYQSNKIAAAGMQAEYQRTISSKGMVAQYGIEAAMPKASDGHSDPVAQAVIKLQDTEIELDIVEQHTRYLEHRWHRITSEKHAMVFNHRIEGGSVEDIQVATGRSKRYVQQYLKECAEMLKD